MSRLIVINGQLKPKKRGLTLLRRAADLIEKKILKTFRKRKKEKIDALLNAAYDFYLDLYLTGTKSGADIHPVFYKKHYTICTLAYRQAMSALAPILEENRINECYRNLQKYLQEKENKKLMQA